MNERRSITICHDIARDAFISISHETLPAWREFARLNTPTVGACVGPAVTRHLTLLEHTLKETGFCGTFLMVLADGLVQDVVECIRRPVFLLHSGPAAAPSGAVHFGCGLGDEGLLSVDMGGTSFAICLINKGEIPTMEPIKVVARPGSVVNCGGPGVDWEAVNVGTDGQMATGSSDGGHRP